MADDWVDVPRAAAPPAAGAPDDDWQDVPARRGAGGDFLQGLGAGTREVIEGIGSGAGIVYDPAVGVLNLASRGLNAAYDAVTGQESDPYLFKPLKEHATAAADAMGLPMPETPLQKVAAPVVEAAATVVPTIGAGIIAKGAQSAPAAVKEAGTFLSAAPDIQIASAAGSGAGSQVAGAVAEKMGAGEGGQKAAEIAGGVLGGLTAGAGYTVLKEGIPATGRLAKQLWEDIVSGSGVEKRAGEALLRNSSDPAALPGRLTDAIDAPSTPGAQPTTAQAVADPGLLAAQNALQSTDPRAAGLIANRNAANNAAWQSTLDSMAPQGAGADAVQSAVRRAFQSFQGSTDEMIQRATQRAQQAIRDVGPDITPERAGQIIREAVGQEYAAARAATGQAYRAIDPAGQSQIPTAPLYAPAAEAVNTRFSTSTFGTPPDINRILTRMRDTDFASLDQIDGIRRDLGDIAGDMARSASERGIAQQLRGQIDDYLARVAEMGADGSNLSPEQLAAMRAAREARTLQGETFERGAVGAVTKTKAFGAPAVPDSGVAAEFLFRGSGSPEAVQQFVAAVGNRPQAVQALQSYAATALRQFATDADGVVNPAKLQRWVQDHQAILQQFPELAGRVNTAMRAQGLVDNLVGRQARAIDDVQRSALGYFIGDMNPDAAVAKVMNSPSSQADLDRLVSVVGRDPEAMGGLRRAIVDFLTGKSLNAGTDIAGNNLLSQAKFGANMDRYGPLLERVFAPEHIQAMRQIQADLDAQQLSTAAKALGSNTVQNLSAASLLSNVSKGTIGMENPIIQTLMRPYSWILKLPEQQVRDLLTDAMLDPALALRLVQGVSPANSTSLSLALRERAAALGIGVAEGMQSEPRQITGPAVGTAIGGQGNYSAGGVVTKPTLKEFLAGDPVPFAEKMRRAKEARRAQEAGGEVQHFADGGVVLNISQPTGRRDDPVKVTRADDAAKAGERVNQKPTPGQKEQGNYEKGHCTWNGLAVTLETPKGGTRKAKDGSWEVKDFPAHYGYIKRTKGADNEHVDVFMGDHPESKRVWIIDQIDPKTRRFDEHKVMLACSSPKQARDLYCAAFSDGSGPKRIGAFTMMSIDQFKGWLKRGKRTKAVGKLPSPTSAAKAA